MTNSIRLQDVADLAGVSIGTASQALNNRPRVAPDTRARVVDAARVLGYAGSQANAAGTQLEVIGMVTRRGFEYGADPNPFYMHVQSGVEKACREQNIRLMFANIEVGYSSQPLIWPAMVRDAQIQGLLLIGAFIPDTIEMLQERLDLPVVLIDGYAPHLAFDSIVIDNTGGAQTAVKHLIAHGHRHIGLIGTHPESPPGVLERRAAYFQVLAEHALPTCYVQESHMSQQQGYEATKALLQRAPDVTAVFAVTDIVAIGALHAARDLGYDVPGDLSVVGFDNIDMASVVTPALTTVHVHKTWMGALGLRRLVERAAGPREPKVTCTVATELVRRESVASCRPD